MGSYQGYTVENLPKSRRLPWRLPALLLLLLASSCLYLTYRPYCHVAGHYRGRIGNEFSYEKFQLVVTLIQNGAHLSGDCEISYQLRGRVILHRGRLRGTAKGGYFRVNGLLDDGRTLHLEGYPKRTIDEAFLMGESWTQSDQGSSSRVGFRLDRLDGRSSPQDLSVRPKSLNPTR